MRKEEGMKKKKKKKESTARTLGDLAVDELLTSAYDEVSYAVELIDQDVPMDKRFIDIDGRKLDLADVALTSAKARLIVVQMKLREAPPKPDSITFSPEELDLLDDVIEYYIMSDMGGGDHAGESPMLKAIQLRVQDTRERGA
jgi:hypothetical protein